jgi:O-antigen ligase
MPDHLRTLIVILVLASVFFYFARNSACAITNTENFARRRNLWFALTLAAFLMANFWLYTAIAIPLLIYANRRESNPTAQYFFILFVVPAVAVQIPGLGIFSNLFELTHARILALFVLLPVYLFLRRQSDTSSFGSTGPDKVLASYLLLLALLYLRDDGHDTRTLTGSFRNAFYLFTDIFLPYFVISRSLKYMQTYRDAILSLVLAIMVIALFAVFESTKYWLLYSSLSSALGMNGGTTHYTGRDGMLRAIVIAGQPIALGYLIAVGMGFYLFLQRSIERKLLRRFGMALLVAGLIAPLSRGPWIGAVVLLVVFIVTGRNAARRLMGLAMAAMFVFVVVSILPGGERVTNLLPFIGTTDKENVDYRDQLITNSMIVIERNPWFGSVTYWYTPEMQAMRQGEGIIDIVNTYIGLALEWGLVGLGLFVAFFVLTLLGIYRAMRSLPDKDSEEYLLGRVLLATLLSIMIMIFTVSSITIIPIVYWSVAGLGVAYAQMLRKRAV